MRIKLYQLRDNLERTHPPKCGPGLNSRSRHPLLINIGWRNGVIVANNSNLQVDAQTSEFLLAEFFHATTNFGRRSASN
jgi:hypothetical protein